MKEQMGLDSIVIPHGVDINVYKPLNKEECKKKLGIQDKFVFGSVAANSDKEMGGGRKAWGPTMKAMRLFLDNNPDVKESDIVWMCHTNPTDPRGFPLIGMAHKFKLDNVIKFASPEIQKTGLSEQQMAELFNSFDVLLNPSKREGFGLPILEAMACGVPVIAVKSSAMTELVQPTTGWLIDVVEDTIFYPTWVDTLQYHHMPSIKSCLERLEQAYESWKTGELEKLRRKCIEFAKQYDWTNIIPMWVDLIEEVREEIEMFRGCFEW